MGVGTLINPHNTTTKTANVSAALVPYVKQEIGCSSTNCHVLYIHPQHLFGREKKSLLLQATTLRLYQLVQ